MESSTDSSSPTIIQSENQNHDFQLTRIDDGRMGSTFMVEDDLFVNLMSKSGVFPASKASIDAMPRLWINEAGAECSVCLELYGVGSEASEMPCKHRFHSRCIEKWLGIHGTCPLCRFTMPAETRDSRLDRGIQGGEGVGESRVGDVTFVAWLDEDSMEWMNLDENLDSNVGSVEHQYGDWDDFNVDDPEPPFADLVSWSSQ